MTQNLHNERVGVWLVGARGSIATCAVYGAAALAEGRIEPLGLATAAPPLSDLDLAPFDRLVFGGHDVCVRDLSRSAGELVNAGVLAPDIVTACTARASEFEARLRPGPLDGPDVGLADLDPRSAELSAAPPREQIARLQADLEAFEKDSESARTVVVYVASTEAARDAQPEWESLARFEEALDGGRAQPASVVYAYAALSSGRPFVNFTPNLGARLPALRQLAEERGVPHCGDDGKTGETLIKTVLAPMFRARALRVLAWQGYNMLGNRDGEVLRQDSHARTKVENKDDALRSILGDEAGLHSKVGIDYVPSLGDWKTAWDLVHFQGFLGTKMSLQFTWQGSDSALAAPLVLDLARLADFAARQGESGVMEHTACFFKAPLGGGTHAFHEQFERLLAYAADHRP